MIAFQVMETNPKHVLLCRTSTGNPCPSLSDEKLVK
jgi:hypothetical protein